MAFVKYTDKLQELVNRGQRALGMTFLKEDNPNNSSGHRNTIEEEYDSHYDGLFCLRIREVEVQQEGQEEPAMQKILTVTDGYNGEYGQNNNYAGVAYVNGESHLILAKSFPISSDETFDTTTTIGVVFIKYTQRHDAYISDASGTEIEIPAETGGIELVYVSKYDEGVTSDIEMYKNDDLYHTYFPIGRVRVKPSGSLFCAQDHTGFPRFNAFLYLSSLESGYMI